ncbi:MAG: SulP family inorganic anion transporter [Flammeovirgaceae bacterium]
MSSNTPNHIPSAGLKGLIRHWRPDFMAAFTVALVALPLGLGIALASKVSPMAGLIAAITGGIVSTFYRGGHLAVTGPAAGLIVVVISTVEAFDGQYQHVLGVFVVAGLLQALFGLIKLGKFGDLFPSAVINGMLAAIGIIIISKQAHIVLGQELSVVPHSAFDALLAIPHSIIAMNPVIALIGLMSLMVLGFHSSIKFRLIHFIPAPVWVLIFAIPLVFLFRLHQDHVIEIFEYPFQLGKHLLIQIPDNPLESIVFPSFDKISEVKFWALAITIALISSIETLLISKAVDKLDPYRRKTHLNKDLIGVGLASACSGCIGGLPIITVIARSSVNVQNGAKTKWSNFYHSIILLLLVLFFEKAIQHVPMAALAAILVYTGYKLASPKVFSDTYKKGVEQALILILTIVTTLISGILWGIFAGVLFTLFIHFIKLGIAPKPFLQLLLKPIIKINQEPENRVYIEVKGISNFFNLLGIKKKLENIPPQQHIVIGLAHARLVDHTVLEYIHDFSEDYEAKGGVFDIVGLGKHSTSSAHPNSLHVLPTLAPATATRLTQRQKRILEVTKANRWRFTPQVTWDTSSYRQYPFFKTRPIEYASNTITGKFNQLIHVHWTISDLTFNEGALLLGAVYHTTLCTIFVKDPLPVFILENNLFLDTNVEAKEIHLPKAKEFHKKYTLRGIDQEKIKELFHADVIAYLLAHEQYHIESNGDSLLLIKNLRFASIQEILMMHRFAEGLMKKFTSFGK